MPKSATLVTVCLEVLGISCGPFGLVGWVSVSGNRGGGAGDRRDEGARSPGLGTLKFADIEPRGSDRVDGGPVAVAADDGAVQAAQAGLAAGGRRISGADV